MNLKSFFARLVILAILFGTATSNLRAQGTAFTYQGQLGTNGVPVTGSYDFRFALVDTNSNFVGFPETNVNVTVIKGIFTTTLDFGMVFTGSNYWLSIGVRTNGGNLANAFTLLSPLQPILPVPYAIFSTTTSNLLGQLPASQLSGALPSAQITGTYSGTVNFSNTTNTFTGTFTGNGGSLTNLNGSAIASGTLADVRLSPNVALLNGSQLYTGANSFTNRSNAFTGNFFGNGVVSWIPVSGTTTQAVANAGYLLLNSNLTTVTLPPTASMLVGDVVRISDPTSGGWLVNLNSGQQVIGSFLSYSNSLWQLANIPATQFWHGMASAGAGTPMYAAGSAGLLVSYNYGNSWSATSITGTSWFSVACSADGRTVYAAPNSGNATGIIQRSTDGGVTWTAILGANNWTAIACSADGTKLIAAATNATAAKSVVYVSSNSGVSSNVVAALPTGSRWSCVSSSADGSRLAAAIYGGAIYYAVNGAWGISAATGPWTSIASSSDGMRMAATSSTNSGGGIFISSNGGASWAQTTAPDAFWYGLSSSSDGSRLVAGASGANLYASGNFGATWTALATTNAVWSCTASSADGSKIAAGINVTAGNIYFSTITSKFTTTTNTTSTLGGGQGTAVELQYIGNNQFMPVSSSGSLWMN